VHGPKAAPGTQSAGPSRKSKRYSAGPSKLGIPVAVPASIAQAASSSAARHAATPPEPAKTLERGAAVPPQPQVPPTATTRSGVSPMTLGIAVGVVLLLAILAGLAYVMQSGDSTPPQEQPPQASNPEPPPVTTIPPTSQPPPPPTTDPNATTPTTTPTTEPPPPADPPAPASMSTVYIDIRPWARVKITTSIPNVTLPAEAQYVPFAIDLPAGDYNLEAENGGLNRAMTFQLKVAEGGAQSYVRSMPGFNATKIVESLLGQD
jgi:hypothetical protein